MVEYKGYIAEQSYNNHVLILKEGKTVLHASCNKKKTDDELKEMIDALIVLREGE